MNTTKLLATLTWILITVSLTIAQDTPKEITLEDIWVSGKFNPKGIQGLVSMNDGLHYTIREKDSINQYRYEDGNLVQTILHAGLLTPEGSEKPIRFSNYSFSNDESKMLLATETEGIYRYSSKSDFYVFDRVT
jgi:dipeptidyl-peptidase 4